MIVTVSPKTRNIKVIREPFESGARNIEEFVKAIAESPDRPDKFELATGGEAIKNIAGEPCDSRSCSVDFIYDGELFSVIINEDDLYRYNRGMPIAFSPC